MRNYLVTIALLLLPGALILGASGLFLLQTDEFLSIAKIIKRQQSSDHLCIYQGGHGDDIPYKLNAYTEIKPSVVIVGSSRSMEFRQKFFTQKFYNAGMGQVSATHRFEKWIEMLLSIHTPGLVIIIPDYWWFESQNVERIHPFSEEDFLPAPRAQPRFFTVPIAKVREKRIGVSEFMAAVTRSFNKGGFCRIGWQAAMKGSGFAPDGSYYYGDQLTDASLSEAEWQFADTIRRLEEGENPQGIDLTARLQFARGLSLLQKAGVPFVVVMPPTAPSVHQAMRDGAYNPSVLDDISLFIQSLEVPFVDAVDALSYGSSDCEFLDGKHGGDVTYARITKKIYDEQQWTRPFINIGEVASIIERSAGLAMDPDPEIFDGDEIDFLKLGCQK